MDHLILSQMTKKNHQVVMMMGMRMMMRMMMMLIKLKLKLLKKNQRWLVLLMNQLFLMKIFQSMLKPMRREEEEENHQGGDEPTEEEKEKKAKCSWAGR